MQFHINAEVNGKQISVNCVGADEYKEALKLLSDAQIMSIDEVSIIDPKVFAGLTPQATPLVNAVVPPHMDSLETSEDCPCSYNPGHAINDPGSAHTVHATGPSMTLYDQIQVLKEAYRGLRMWHMGADGVADMLAQHGIKVIERDKDNIEFIQFVRDEPMPPVQIAQPNVARRIVGVTIYQDICQTKVQYSDGSSEFAGAARIIDRVGSKNEDDPGIAQLADIYQERAEQSADSVIASLQAECGKLRQELEALVEVAKSHGWGPAQGVLPIVLKRWLDEFVAAVQLNQWQADQITQFKLELRETSREATSYADTCGRLRKELAQLQVYVSQGGMNDKVLNLGGAGGQTPGAAGQPGQHRVYNPLYHD